MNLSSRFFLWPRDMSQSSCVMRPAPRVSLQVNDTELLYLCVWKKRNLSCQYKWCLMCRVMEMHWHSLHLMHSLPQLWMLHSYLNTCRREGSCAGFKEWHITSFFPAFTHPLCWSKHACLEEQKSKRKSLVQFKGYFSC